MSWLGHSLAGSPLVTPLVRSFIKSVFTPVRVGREDALKAVERLSALTHLVSSAEYLARPQDIAVGSLGDWKVNREKYGVLGAKQQKVLDWVSRLAVTRALHIGRLASAAVLLAPSKSPVRAAANGYLAATSALLYPRHHYGTDGSDQVSFQSSAVSCIARTLPSTPIQDSALWYLALQSSLAYGVSGWVKLFGPSWRSGQAVPGVMRTRTYGHPGVWSLVKDRPKLAATMAHAMLAAEGLFPLVIVSRGRFSRPFLIWAVGFHTFIGGSMGLGRFVLAFGSMLPAVAYATNGEPKDNTMPKFAGVMVGSALGAGAVAAAIRRRRVLAADRQMQRLRTRAGNEVTYTFRPGLSPQAPVVVLEHGLLATPEHFAWIARSIPDDTAVLCYPRAGYGASLNRTGRYGIEKAAQDLGDLLDEAVPTGAPVYLAGHSMGGLIARLTAQQSDRHVGGVIYIDSSHPGQLERSKLQRDGAQHFTQAFQGLAASLHVGLGWLLAKPDWVKALPADVQGQVLTQYRDGRLWRAGHQEWIGAERHFAQKSNHELRELQLPALVISARTTLNADPVQHELHADFLTSHAASLNTRELIIDQANHDSLLTKQDHAELVGEAIGSFIRDCEGS